MHKNGNIGIKDLRMGIVKNRFGLKWGLNPGPLLFQSNTVLSELIFQVLVEGYWFLLAQIGECQTGMAGVLGLILTGGNFFNE